MPEPRECYRCHTFFIGPACPRCDYRSTNPFARRTRQWAPYQAGWNKRRDGPVRVIKPPPE